MTKSQAKTAEELLKQHKPAPVSHGPPSCSPHNDPTNHRDEVKGNRVRTTCRVCGRFIGYRPVNEGAAL